MLGMMDAYLRGVPVVVVAANALYRSSSPTALLQVAADSPLRTGADLNGKICAVGAIGDLNTLATSVWVDKNGGDSKTLKFVEIPVSAVAEALAQHRVDAAIMLQPMLDNSLADGKTRTLGDAYGAIASTFMYGAWAARADWAAQHAELLRRYVRVSTEAARYTNAHPAETAPIMAEVTKIPLPVMLKMHRVATGLALDPATVQPVIDAAAKYHQIPRAFAAKDFFWSDPGR
jgi:NitT/TauT family transport system substrate-binding protein